MFTFEVYDISDEGEEKVIAAYTFDDLAQAKEYARDTITKDEQGGKDYAYFIIDDKEEVYDIWE